MDDVTIAKALQSHLEDALRPRLKRRGQRDRKPGQVEVRRALNRVTVWGDATGRRGIDFEVRGAVLIDRSDSGGAPASKCPKHDLANPACDPFLLMAAMLRRAGLPASKAVK